MFNFQFLFFLVNFLSFLFMPFNFSLMSSPSPNPFIFQFFISVFLLEHHFRIIYWILIELNGCRIEYYTIDLSLHPALFSQWFAQCHNKRLKRVGNENVEKMNFRRFLFSLSCNWNNRGVFATLKQSNFRKKMSFRTKIEARPRKCWKWPLNSNLNFSWPLWKFKKSCFNYKYCYH